MVLNGLSFYILVSFEEVIGLELANPPEVVLAFPYKTQGQLRTIIWADAIQYKVPHDSLVEMVLSFFLFDRLKQKFVLDLVYRVQKQEESLVEFCQTVQTSSKLLLPHIGEEGVLKAVLTGINTKTRACMSGFQAPRSIHDLIMLAPRIEVVRQCARSDNLRP